MTSFSVSRLAEIDLLDIATFTLERWGSPQMERYLRELDQCFGFLAKHPNAGKSIDRVAQGFRQFPQGSQVIFYRLVESDEVEIIRMLRKRQLVYDIDLLE